MELMVNGEPVQVPDGLDLAALLRLRDLDPAVVVVERNGGIVAREAFGRVRLDPDDRLEILYFVGGG